MKFNKAIPIRDTTGVARSTPCFRDHLKFDNPWELPQLKIAWRIQWLFFLILALDSCEKFKLEGQVSSDPVFIHQLYSNANDTIVIDGQKLVISADLSRDFLPGGFAKKNTRLVANIWIINTDSTRLTDAITPSKLYVIHQDEVWISPLKASVGNTNVYSLDLYCNDGPYWNTGTTADVVVSINDLTDNTEKLLITRNQIIVKTR